MNAITTPLANEHHGMRVDYSGLLRQAIGNLHQAPANAEMLRQLQLHLAELGQRWYRGDASVVDEFLQLYCVASEDRAAAVAAQPGGAAPPAARPAADGYYTWEHDDGRVAVAAPPAAFAESDPAWHRGVPCEVHISTPPTAPEATQAPAAPDDVALMNMAEAAYADAARLGVDQYVFRKLALDVAKAFRAAGGAA